MHDERALFVAFGLPGAGKSYVARAFEDFGFYYYDGDHDLTEDMKLAIATQTPINDAMRDVFFSQIIESVTRLQQIYPRLVVAQTFIKEKYRRLVLAHFPDAGFVLVVADDAVRERRLMRRTQQALDPDYARRMAQIFEPPQLEHSVIANNSDGRDDIRRQITAILSVGKYS